jgi:hypothetical protein
MTLTTTLTHNSNANSSEKSKKHASSKGMDSFKAELTLEMKSDHKLTTSEVPSPSPSPTNIPTLNL